MTPPAADELEVSLFGPGFGECLVLHVGSGNWIVIDCCVDAGNNIPVPLYYFHQMGIEPNDHLRLIVVTHWHDDHIRGIGKLLNNVPSARICIPQAMAKRDILAGVLAVDEAFTGVVSSGVSEIRQVFESRQMKVAPILATENTILWSMKGAHLAHGENVELRALSPSGLQGIATLRRFAGLVPAPHAIPLSGRMPRSGSNDMSIATWLSVGERSLLLGADLEVHANAACGWGGVRALALNLPGDKAEVFKVPHHGSATGHDALVWRDLLASNPIALVSPWNHGGQLPQPEDLARIAEHTVFGYITNPGHLAKSSRRDALVEKMIREFAVNMRNAEGQIGHIRLRRKPNSAWAIEKFGTAASFTDAA